MATFEKEERSKRKGKKGIGKKVEPRPRYWYLQRRATEFRLTCTNPSGLAEQEDGYADGSGLLYYVGN